MMFIERYEVIGGADASLRGVLVVLGLEKQAALHLESSG
jgi:hypothetical protein